MRISTKLVQVWPASWRSYGLETLIVVKPGDERYDEDLPLVRDTYEVGVDEDRVRARGCLCTVPCLSFTCISSHHRGSRNTPWCRGCDDSDELKHHLGPVEYKQQCRRKKDRGWCDDCWEKTLRGYINKRVRDFKRHKKHRFDFLELGDGRQVMVQSVGHLRELLWERGMWLPDKILAGRRQRE